MPPPTDADYRKAPAASKPRANEVTADSIPPGTFDPPPNPKTFKFLPDLLKEKGDAYMPPLEEVTMTLFGSPGTGKTTLAAGRPGTFFIATEPGQYWTGAPSEEVRSWEKFQNIVDELVSLKKSGTLPYRSVAIDIVDNLAGYCLEAVCGAKGLEYPPENDFGKTWKQIRVQWETWMRLLMDTVNVTFLTHCATEKKEVQGKVGKKEVDQFAPTFRGNKQAQYLDGVVHAVGYVHKNLEDRYVVTFVNSATCAAKDRTKILAELGEVDITGGSPQECWSILATAYAELAAKQGFKIKSKW